MEGTPVKLAAMAVVGVLIGFGAGQAGERSAVISPYPLSAAELDSVTAGDLTATFNGTTYTVDTANGNVSGTAVITTDPLAIEASISAGQGGNVISLP